MTAQNRATLKAVFEDGDIPTGSNYADLIDSFVSIADTTAQSMSSKLTLDTAEVTDTVTAATVHVETGMVLNIEATSAVSAAASAARYIAVTVSGVSYWMPLYAD